MKLTIGMASYRNYTEVWFTVQALRLYHDLTDCEILVIDNYGEQSIKDWINQNGHGHVRYELCNEIQGTSYPRNKVFELATGEFVLCVDSHVLFKPGAISYLKTWIDNNKDNSDFIQGPLVYDFLDGFVDRLNPEWRCHMYGIWGDNIHIDNLPTDPYEIPMMGLGVFGCFKDKWLGFNKDFKGFGGEEGYIHEKYRKAGFKTLSLPELAWVHKFHDQTSQTLYPNILEDRVRNYLIGFTELGLDVQQVIDHFGEGIVKRSGWKKE
jgi:glycosyltransferase involved in cell wall biosynthesis